MLHHSCLLHKLTSRTLIETQAYGKSPSWTGLFPPANHRKNGGKTPEVASGKTRESPRSPMRATPVSPILLLARSQRRPSRAPTKPSTEMRADGPRSRRAAARPHAVDDAAAAPFLAGADFPPFSDDPVAVGSPRHPPHTHCFHSPPPLLLKVCVF